MATTPEALPENPQDFRAPPPSPVANAAGRRSVVMNDEELSEFLDHSLRVPDLILPDRIFPKHISIQDLPEIDFGSLIKLENNSISEILDAAAAIGCFQIVNHGISRDLIRSVSIAATHIFGISPKKKAIASRSSGRMFGFEEFSSEEEADMTEEFVWCRDDCLQSLMEGIWPDGYSNFSEKMESLSKEIEKVASKVLLMLLENIPRSSINGTEIIKGQELVGTICCLYKHCPDIPAGRWVSSLKSDVMRMLLRGSDYSHALCVHICEGSSEFHVYSKKGWMSFCPNKDAIIVTIGDQIQAWSGGQYKHVTGRPIFKAEEESISLAFLNSPPTVTQNSQGNREKMISLGQQAKLAIILTLIYHILLYIYQNF